MFAGCYASVDIEFIEIILFERDMYSALRDELFAALHRLAVAVAQHFELLFGPAYECTQCNGNGQTYHTRSGNTHTHGVLENVGAQSHIHPLGSGAEQLGGLCHTQCHGNGLGAANGGHHLSLDKGYYRISFFSSNHSIIG